MLDNPQRLQVVIAAQKRLTSHFPFASIPLSLTLPALTLVPLEKISLKNSANAFPFLHICIIGFEGFVEFWNLGLTEKMF